MEHQNRAASLLQVAAAAAWQVSAIVHSFEVFRALQMLYFS